MIRMGIVGAENTHSAAIAKTINVDKQIKGVQVVAIWGETDEFAKKAAETGRIPLIVKDPAEMIGQIDAVMIDHRHAKYHLPAAEPFLAAKLPLFIDKPFCYRLKEGKAFLARARKMGVPVTSFSVLPEQKSFARLRKEIERLGPLKTLAAVGPCDINSVYGGVFFYGIHPVGAIVENAYTDFAQMVVVESGAQKVGLWVSEERNIYEDYKRAFGEEPPLMNGVAIMTDTDNTKERATAYYGDIQFVSVGK